MSATFSRPVYCEIDLAAIASNLRLARQIVGERTQIMAVVKANAYGHGALEVARTALAAGAEWLGVAFVEEGLALRQAGISAPILVLGWTPAEDAPRAIAGDLHLALYDIGLARAYAGLARQQGRQAQVHLKIDTGMGRLGVLAGEAAEFARVVAGLEGLAIRGVFTHFSTADSADSGYTLQQLGVFLETLAALETILPRSQRIAHAANSAAALALPPARLDMVRLGIAMYGLHPSDEVRCPPGFEPALAWKAALAQVKTLPAGHPVSYGNTYVTRQEEKIGVIPVGYADGFRRGAANEVLIGGKRLPVIGRVCMDQSMVSLSGLPQAAMGDEVVLIGRQGEQAITAEEMARRWGTINYEVTSGIMARVPRRYTNRP